MAGLREEEVLKELLQLLQDFDGEFERMYRLLEKILYLLDCPELQETETHQKEYFRFLQELCRIKAVSGQYAPGYERIAAASGTGAGKCSGGQR